MKLIVVCLAVLAVGTISATPLAATDSDRATFFKILGRTVSRTSAATNQLLLAFDTKNPVRSVTDSDKAALRKVLGSIVRTSAATNKLLFEFVSKNIAGVTRAAPILAPVEQLPAGVTAALNGIVAAITELTPFGYIIRNDYVAIEFIVFDLDEFAATVAAIFDGTLNGINVNDILGALDGLLNNLLGSVQDLITQVVANVTGLLNQVSAAVDEALYGLQLALQSVVEIVSETLTGLFDKLRESELGGALNGLLSQASIVVAYLLSQVAALVNDNLTEPL